MPRTAFPAEGSALLDVMIALSLLAIVLVSLGGTAAALLSRAGRLDFSLSGREDGPAADQWTWGPRPGVVVWLPGPNLELRLQGAGTQAADWIGVWVDGWLESEVSARDQGVLPIGAPGMWSSKSGSEVIVRARRQDGAWGSPWRSVVPSPVGSGAMPNGQTVGTAMLAVHLPAAGETSFNVDLGVTPAVVDAVATPTSVTVGVSGVAAVTGAGAPQKVLVEGGTDVDVYQ